MLHATGCCAHFPLFPPEGGRGGKACSGTKKKCPPLFSVGDQTINFFFGFFVFLILSPSRKVKKGGGEGKTRARVVLKIPPWPGVEKGRLVFLARAPPPSANTRPAPGPRPPKRDVCRSEAQIWKVDFGSALFKNALTNKRARGARKNRKGKGLRGGGERGAGLRGKGCFFLQRQPKRRAPQGAAARRKRGSKEWGLKKKKVERKWAHAFLGEVKSSFNHPAQCFHLKPPWPPPP